MKSLSQDSSSSLLFGVHAHWNTKKLILNTNVTIYLGSVLFHIVIFAEEIWIQRECSHSCIEIKA